MKFRLWLNVPRRRVVLVSHDLDGPYDAEILLKDLLKAIPDAVGGVDCIDSKVLLHSLSEIDP